MHRANPRQQQDLKQLYLPTRHRQTPLTMNRTVISPDRPRRWQLCNALGRFIRPIKICQLTRTPFNWFYKCLASQEDQAVESSKTVPMNSTFLLGNLFGLDAA